MEILTPVEIRVLGSLVEKKFTTPDYYPLSLNALITACNQKSNREPVMELTESDVSVALDRLQRLSLIGITSGAVGRVVRYRHLLEYKYGLEDALTAVLGLLMLRGPQTPGELRGRSSRLHAFSSLEEVIDVLEKLESEGLVRSQPRRHGQKEIRYAHLLAGEPEPEGLAASGAAAVASDGQAKLDALEAEVAQLQTKLAQLKEQFEAFQRAFE